MRVKIKDNVRDIKFSIRSLNWLDEVYKMTTKEGISFGLGVQLLYNNLDMRNVPALNNALVAGLLHEKGISFADIEEYIMEVADSEEDALERLFEQVIEKLKKSSLTKLTIKKVLEEQKKVQEA